MAFGSSGGRLIGKDGVKMLADLRALAAKYQK